MRVLFLDYRKAFDLINHDISIDKLVKMELGESCRDWTSSLIGPVLYIPDYCTPRHPLSIMSFISGISDDTVSFDEIAALFKYFK